MNPRATVTLVCISMLLASCNIDLKRYFSADETRMRQDWPETDFSRRTISLGEVTYQALPKDAIPAIDNPVFKYINDIGWIQADEPVIVLESGNEAKAYPLQIMLHHEIVNDTIEGKPVAITFCPLCNAAIVFSRQINNEVLDFGVSGSLRKSDLVMYDRQSKSWWQQFTGKGIVGKYSGVTLERLPSRVIAYQDFVNAFPHGQVLSRETGFNRLYGENPFRGYDSINNSPFLYFDPHDKRLAPMTRVLAVSVNDNHRIYPLITISKHHVINDEFLNNKLVIFSKQGMRSAVDEEWIEDSRKIPAAVAYSRQLQHQTLRFTFTDKKIIDEQTGSEWNILGQAVTGPLKGSALQPIGQGVHFAFAWLAFQPQSEIYTTP